MKSVFRLSQLSPLDWRAVTAVVASTLILSVDEYHPHLGSGLFGETLLYLVAPLLVIWLVWRQPASEYGLRLGDWRAGLLLTIAACAGMAAVMLVVGRTAAFQSYYGRATEGRLPFWLADGIELLGWEFFFRGFLLFALYRAVGPIALVLQAVPFTMAHFGKPELETLSCMFGGTAFGYVAWRTRSFLYPFLIHWFLASFTALVASGAI